MHANEKSKDFVFHTFSKTQNVTKDIMKFFTLIIATTFFAVSAFGVSPISKNIHKRVAQKSPLRKDSASTSPLFRDAAKTRGGAVPGWSAYNEQLDKNPITTKALTSMAGFAIGDFLAQVRLRCWTCTYRSVIHFFVFSLFLSYLQTRT